VTDERTYVDMVWAGMLLPTGAEDRPTPTVDWPVPVSVQPAKHAGLDGIAYLPVRRGQVRMRRSTSRGGSDMLERFSELDGASSAEIAKYAARWGVLHVCTKGHVSCKRRCGATFHRSRLWEPIEAWHAEAKTAGAILGAAAKLHLKKAADKDDWAPLVGPGQAEGYARFDLDTQRLLLAGTVNGWLERAAVLPKVGWWGDSLPVIALVPKDLYGALAVAVAYAVSTERGAAVCSSCKRVYPVTRRPRADRANYCPTCRDNGAPARERQRRLRARRNGSQHGSQHEPTRTDRGGRRSRRGP
jgi:hypothetical protein